MQQGGGGIFGSAGRSIERFVLFIAFLVLLVLVRFVWTAVGGEPGSFNDFSPALALICVGVVVFVYERVRVSTGRSPEISRGIVGLYGLLLLVAVGVSVYMYSGRLAEERRAQQRQAERQAELAQQRQPERQVDVNAAMQMLQSRRAAAARTQPSTTP